MADRYEPKLSVRPTSERKGSDGRQPAADDPLAELARIVSGRGPAGSAPRQRPAEPPRPAAPPPDVVGDLEAELLSDLEASFAAVKQQISAQNQPAAPEPAPLAPPPMPPRQQQPAPPAAAPSPPPRPKAPELPSPVLPSPVLQAAPTIAPPPVKPPAPPPQAAEPAPQPSVAPQPPPAQPRSPVAARPPLQAGTSPMPVPPRAQPAPTAGGRKVDIANLQLRPSTVAPPRPNPPQAGAAEPPQPKPSRWDKPAEPPRAEASPASRFAPPKAAGAPAPAPQQRPPEEEEFPFSDTFPFSGQSESAAAEEELPLDGFDALPGFGEEDQLAPYPDEDEFDDMPRRGVPRSLIAVAGLLAVVLIAGIGFLMLRPGGGSEAAPPIIAADNSPTKVAPPEPPSTDATDQQNKLIYDRVDSGAGAGTGDTTLVTPGSQPIAPVTDSGSDNPISRVILHGGPAPEPPGASGDATAGGNSNLALNDDGDNAADLGPKKVRTVIVRPDGTIVSSDAVPADGAPASGAAADTTANVPAVPAIPPAATDDDTAAIAGSRAGEELAITPLGGNDVTAPAPVVSAPTPPVRTPTPPPPTTPTRTTVANSSQGPIDLTRGAGSASTATPTVSTSTSGMMVQVSSQRSEEAATATYRDLQRRYAGILGSYEPNIQRADLGDRGVYYRVRVGPFSPNDAQDLCTSLKSAGGDCILAKR